MSRMTDKEIASSLFDETKRLQREVATLTAERDEKAREALSWMSNAAKAMADVERLTKARAALVESARVQREAATAAGADAGEREERHLAAIETLRDFVMRVAPELSRQSGEASNLVLDATDYAKKADEVAPLPCRPSCRTLTGMVNAERCVACKVNDDKGGV